MTVHQFFGQCARFFERVHYSDDRQVRSICLIDPQPFMVDLGDRVGLSIHTSAGFHTRRRRLGHQTYSGAAATGRAFLSGPGDRFQLEIDGACRAIQLGLSGHVFEQIMLEDHDRTGGVAALRAPWGSIDPELLRLAGWALLAKSDMRELAIRAVVARLTTEHGAWRNTVHARGLSPIRLRRVRDLVEASLEHVSLSAMAQEAGVSVYHFSREFKRETGQTPWGYVMMRRVWRAAELLCAGERADDVARRTGFADASHMRRNFRKTIGATPSAVVGRLLV